MLSLALTRDLASFSRARSRSLLRDSGDSLMRKSALYCMVLSLWRMRPKERRAFARARRWGIVIVIVSERSSSLMREFGSKLVEVYWCRRRGLRCAASVFTKNKQQSAWRSARAYTKQSALCESVCVSKFGEHVVFASCVMNCMTVWLAREKAST